MDFAMRALGELAELAGEKYEKIDGVAEKLTEERLFAAAADAPAFEYGARPRGVDAQIAALLEPPKTLGDVAALRGASTPGETLEFCSAVKRLNPELLAGRPDAGLSGVPMSELGKSVLAYPDVYYYRDRRGWRARLGARDYYDVRTWDETQKSRLKGEGLFSRGRRAVFLKESQAGETAHGNNMSVHEAGHAFEEALRLKFPDLHSELLEASRQAYARAEQAQDSVTPYASFNEQEFRAESFAALFSSENRGRLGTLDSAWRDRLEKIIGDAGGASAATPARQPR